MNLYINDKIVVSGPMRIQPGKFTLSGVGLCVGCDSGDALSKEYKTPGEFKSGKIQRVGVTVEKAQYLDLQQEAQRAFRDEGICFGSDLRLLQPQQPDLSLVPAA